MTTKQKIKELLYQSNEVKDFALKNSLSDDELFRSISPLSLYKESNEICKQCDGITCKNNVDQMIANLVIDENRKVRIVYEDCYKLRSSTQGNLETIHYTENDFEITITDQRLSLLEKFNKFEEEYFQGKKPKGIYLFGKCGTGKSLMLFRFAKNLAKDGAKVIFAYYPDLIREIQNSMGTPKLEKSINSLKCIDILIFDDIAREANNPYIRDEILGPILQYRCDNNLPMFMTSNRDFRLLEKHLSETNAVIDSVKGKALIERIKYLMTEYELVDKDFRNN